MSFKQSIPIDVVDFDIGVEVMLRFLVVFLESERYLHNRVENILFLGIKTETNFKKCPI